MRFDRGSRAGLRFGTATAPALKMRWKSCSTTCSTSRIFRSPWISSSFFQRSRPFCSAEGHTNPIALMLKVINVVGARPNFMKMAPIIEAMNRHPGQFQHLLVHTGQHYDDRMSKSFFTDLGMPRPDIDLEVGSGSHAEQTARVMVEFEKVCMRERPDLVIVVGDVNSTMACAITAKK